jgi:hypothetical protein
MSARICIRVQLGVVDGPASLIASYGSHFGNTIQRGAMAIERETADILILGSG